MNHPWNTGPTCRHGMRCPHCCPQHCLHCAEMLHCCRPPHRHGCCCRSRVRLQAELAAHCSEQGRQRAQVLPPQQLPGDGTAAPQGHHHLPAKQHVMSRMAVARQQVDDDDKNVKNGKTQLMDGMIQDSHGHTHTLQGRQPDRE